MKRWLPKFCHLLCYIWAIFHISISPEQYFYYQKVLILAIIDDLVNDEHMVITWVTAFLLLNIETINKQVFCQLLHRATDYFLLLIKFRNISTLECYSCSEHSLVPPRHCAPSNEMTILTKTKRLFWQKQNDHSDKNKMTIPTKKMIFLTKYSKSYSFHQIH